MLLVVGPRRSGKGTIGRILRSLVGRFNVAGPTTSSLAGNFGLQPLIGKSLAIISDARFSGGSVATVVERLLCISGEDTLTIDRKYLGSVCMKLPTRFVFLTNELPLLQDSSSALTGRFLVLRLEKSFYGKEDTTLGEILAEELPGILIHPHGLRHTYAAELRAEGVDIAVICKQLGHRSIATTARYLDHIAPTDVFRAMNRRIIKRRALQTPAGHGDQRG